MRKVSMIVVAGLVSAMATAAMAAPNAGAPAVKAAPPPPVAPPVPPAPPAQIKATVDAFKGNWKLAATVTPPGQDKPLLFKMSMNCKAIAAGNAVSCDGKAKTPMGPWAGNFVVAYDAYSKAVHFFGVTSDFEVHDHVCQWSTPTDLKCTPLKGGTGPGGEEITEDLSMHFDKRTMEMTSASHMKGGATMTFAAKGKR